MHTDYRQMQNWLKQLTQPHTKWSRGTNIRKTGGLYCEHLIRTHHKGEHLLKALWTGWSCKVHFGGSRTTWVIQGRVNTVLHMNDMALIFLQKYTLQLLNL